MRNPHGGLSDSVQAIFLNLLPVCIVLPIFTAPVAADDWPFFRGPHYNGVSLESGWLDRWPESVPLVAWQKDLGIGASSFAVVNDHVLSMGNQQDTDTVWCLDADSGRVIWRFDYPCKFKDHNFEGGTSSTPTVDGAHVYTLSYDGQVHCLNAEDGQPVWRRHLVDDFDGRYSSWDYAGSPLVTDNLVIFDTGADGNSTVALDKTSGKKIWGVGEDLAGYATPIPFEHQGVRGVLVFKARAMVAHELTTGRELWRIGWKTNYDVNASSPTVIEDKLFISSGYTGRRARGALFQLGPSEPRQIWENGDIETKMNSAVVYDGHLYCISERQGGQLMCVDMINGNTVWAESSFAPYGTLMIADGKLVILDEEGDLVIADATPQQYRELARRTVLSGRCWVMPVLANGRIYVRNNQGQMACLDLRKE